MSNKFPAAAAAGLRTTFGETPTFFITTPVCLSGSQPVGERGVYFALLRGYLAISGDVFGCYNWSGVGAPSI